MAKKSSDNFRDWYKIWCKKYESLENARPTLKLVWMIFSLAIKWKYKKTFFGRERNEKEDKKIIVRYDDKIDLYPPPRHLFPDIVKILRWIGQEAIKRKQKSCFRYLYSDDGRKEEVCWWIDYNVKKNPLNELTRLMARFCEMENAEQVVEKTKRR